MTTRSAAVACLFLSLFAQPAAATAAKDGILVNHVGFVPQSAKFCVVLNPSAKEFSVFKGMLQVVPYLP